MGRGGKRKGAGRPKGARDKIKTEQPEQREAFESVQTPLEYMLAVMRDRGAEWKRRDDMAKAAAPYVHGKVSDKPAGKKDQAQAAADNAGQGSEWEDDLAFDGARPN